MYWPRLVVALAATLLLMPGAQAISLQEVAELGEQRYLLRGRFGPRCSDCEVLVEYADGLRYAHAVESWEERRIVARIVDLNRPVDVRISVLSAVGASDALSLRLATALKPATNLTEPVLPNRLPRYGFFERRYDLKVGDKGEDHFDVSTAPPACGEASWVFDHARLVYLERRFADAQIVALPQSGCFDCAPLTVRRYHEPTGRLGYQLHVYRRLIEGICPARVR